jgi:hypothetical protein
MIRHGVVNLNLSREIGQTFSIKAVFQHPKYIETAYYDIAVLQIAPVTFDAHLRPICLPDSSEFTVNAYDNDAADLIGWAVKNYWGKLHQNLKEQS